MKLIIILLAIAITYCNALPHFGKIDVELDNHWETFKLKFNKQYHSQDEYMRRLIWESNLKFIQQHNLEFDLGKHSYSLGVNHFADLTHAEFKNYYLNSKRPNNRTQGSFYMSPMNRGSAPDTVDWRTLGYVTEVKDQGQCGSCWSFSTTGSLEGQYFHKTGQLQSFSEQQLVDCSRQYGNYGCNGGLMDYAFSYIKDYGIELESQYPYTARDGTCKYDAASVITKVTGFVDVQSGDENGLKDAVGTVGPISVAIDASRSSFQFYKSGVYDEPSCSSTQLDHGVLAVGYGSESNQDYWIVKNSWGPSWGSAGYIKMSRGKNNQCGIATAASYPLL